MSNLQGDQFNWKPCFTQESRVFTSLSTQKKRICSQTSCQNISASPCQKMHISAFFTTLRDTEQREVEDHARPEIELPPCPRWSLRLPWNNVPFACRRAAVTSKSRRVSLPSSLSMAMLVASIDTAASGRYFCRRAAATVRHPLASSRRRYAWVAIPSIPSRVPVHAR